MVIRIHHSLNIGGKTDHHFYLYNNDVLKHL